MLSRLKIVRIPCLKTCAAAFCYQWTLITEVGYTRVIKVTAISGYSVVFVVVCSLFIHYVLLFFAFVFVSICACLFLLFFYIVFNICFIPTISGKSVLKTECVHLHGPVWDLRYMSKGQVACFNAQGTASISC